MSEYSASTLRGKMKDKAKRLATGDPHQKVDASSWTPDEAMDADIKTGMRPVSRQARKSGGQVSGDKAPQRADRKPRQSGGVVNEYINRNEKAANAERAGLKHRDGLATGGAADYVPTSRLAFSSGESRLSKAAGLKDGGYASARHGNKRPGRSVGGAMASLSPAYAILSGALADDDKDKPVARKSGGKVGKTNINIIIGQPPQSGGDPLPPQMPPVPPMPPKPPGMPPGLAAGPPMPPPGAPPMGAPVPMPRRRGGRTYDAGAGSGEGRLEKIDAYGK